MEGFEEVQTQSPAPTSGISAALAPAKPNPFNKTVLLSVTVKMAGTSKKVDNGAVECDTDKTMLRVSKKIIDCEEYKAIQTAVSELKKMLRARTVPGVSFIKGGIYPIPTSRIEEVDQKTNEHIANYNGKVARFLEVYESRRDEAVTRLASIGNAADYPSLDAMKKMFGITTEYVTLGPPASLQSINKAIWEQEHAKFEAKCQGAADQAQDAMRVIFSDMVNHMVERLTPGEDGKKKKFSESTIANFKEFFDLFEDRNITDDESLAQAVQQAQNILAGKSVDAIRKDDDVRAVVTERMTEVKLALDSLLVDSPGRAITIDDDGEDAAEPASDGPTGFQIEDECDADD